MIPPLYEVNAHHDITTFEELLLHLSIKFITIDRASLQCINCRSSLKSRCSPYESLSELPLLALYGGIYGTSHLRTHCWQPVGKWVYKWTSHHLLSHWIYAHSFNLGTFYFKTNKSRKVMLLLSTKLKKIIKSTWMYVISTHKQLQIYLW